MKTCCVGYHLIDWFVGVKRHVNTCGSFCVVSQKGNREIEEMIEEMKEREGQKRGNLIKVKKQKKRKYFPLYPTYCKNSRPCPTVSQSQSDGYTTPLPRMHVTLLMTTNNTFLWRSQKNISSFRLKKKTLFNWNYSPHWSNAARFSILP